MNQHEQERLHRFVSDSLMADVIKDQLQKVFLRKRDGDVHTKAAQMMALDMLEEAWKELRYKGDVEKKRPPRQTGL